MRLSELVRKYGQMMQMVGSLAAGGSSGVDAYRRAADELLAQIDAEISRIGGDRLLDGAR